MRLLQSLLLPGLLLLAACGGPSYEAQVKKDLALGNYDEVAATLSRHLYDHPKDRRAAAYLLVARALQQPDSAFVHGITVAEIPQKLSLLDVPAANFRPLGAGLAARAARYQENTKAAVRRQLRLLHVETDTFADVEAILAEAAGIMRAHYDARMREVGEVTSAEGQLYRIALAVQARKGDAEAATRLVDAVGAIPNDLDRYLDYVGAPLIAPLAAEVAKSESAWPRHTLAFALARAKLWAETEVFALEHPAIRLVRGSDLETASDTAIAWSSPLSIGSTAYDRSGSYEPMWLAGYLHPVLPKSPSAAAVSFNMAYVGAPEDGHVLFALSAFDPTVRRWQLRLFELRDGVLKRLQTAQGTDVSIATPFWANLTADQDSIYLQTNGIQRSRTAWRTEQVWNPSAGYFGGYENQQVSYEEPVWHMRYLAIGYDGRTGRVSGARLREASHEDTRMAALFGEEGGD